MPVETFSLLTSRVFTPADLTDYVANGDYDLFISAVQSNNNNLSALRLVIDYESSTQAQEDRNWQIMGVVEGSNGLVDPNTRWFTLGYQFEPFQQDGNGKRRVILLGQGMPNAEGVDDIVYIGTPRERISRIVSKLAASFRVRLILRELGYGTANAFQNITISIYGEKFDG